MLKHWLPMQLKTELLDTVVAAVVAAGGGGGESRKRTGELAS